MVDELSPLLIAPRRPFSIQFDHAMIKSSRKELEATAAKLRQEIEAGKATVRERRTRLAKIEKQLARIEGVKNS